MARMKVLLSVLMILVIVFLCPAARVLADETQAAYSEDVPYLEGIEVLFQRNDASIGWGWLTGSVEKQRSISFIKFEHDRLSAVDYTKYEIVFEYVLKSQMEDGSVKTHNYSYVGDFTDENSPGFFDNLLISISLKDDYFIHNFSYLGIINQSPDFQEKVSSGLASGRGLNAYNTIISQVDCYLREKETGKIGLVSRFSFIWDSDFWNQCCTGITYNLIVPGTDVVLGSQMTQDTLFAGKLSSDGTSWFQDFQSEMSGVSDFLVGLPEMLYIIASNVILVSAKLLELLQVVFPFIPGWMFYTFIVLIIFGLFVGLWKLIKGN